MAVNQYAEQISNVWFRHPVTLVKPGSRDALGRTTGETRSEIHAAVDGQAQTVTDRNGQEVTAAATLRWHVDGPLPDTGWKITLPGTFGLKPNREIITARRVDSGTDMTPDFVEVTVR